jgi:AraC family transcriptional regulator of adaptative response / DNA-3-methyladenine glycosylase II
VLPRRDPFDAAALLGWLAARAVPGVEAVEGTTYTRSLGLAHGDGVVAIELDGGPLRCRWWLDDARDRDAAPAAVARLLDLGADPAAIDARLGADPLLMALVAAHPGLRCPGAVDGAEPAVRAVLGQQVSLAAARTLAGRLTAELGRPLRAPRAGVTHRFVTPVELLAGDPDALRMPRARARALHALARALADGDVVLAPGADAGAVRAALLALPGIGPWTADYVVMRALGDPDVFLATDLGVRRALARLPGAAAAGRVATGSWAPWRSYATQHLWQALADATLKPPAAPPRARARPSPRR